MITIFLFPSLSASILKSLIKIIIQLKLVWHKLYFISKRYQPWDKKLKFHNTPLIVFVAPPTIMEWWKGITYLKTINSD